MRSTRKIVIATLIVLFFGCVGSTIFIHVTYAYTKPSVPEPQSGRVRQMVVNHGTVVYVTDEEFQRADFVLNKVFWIGIVSFVGLAIVRVYWQKSRSMPPA